MTKSDRKNRKRLAGLFRFFLSDAYPVQLSWIWPEATMEFSSVPE